MSNPEDYTVGWICAVLKEYTAAQLLLDKEHDRPHGISHSDTNHYTLGEIAGHNVVMAVLPDGEYGVGSAAGVVTNMLHSFPNILIGLMVGIGGGAPTLRNDIRLGDVVVSSPSNGTGGVYQYDFGKTIQGIGFVQTGFLDQPSTTVRSALLGLRRKYDLDGHRIKETIDEILRRWPRLRKKGYARPCAESDRLFASNIVHPQESDCDCEEVCAKQPFGIVVRQPRDAEDDDPTIHYGLIASGNQLMKDAIVRDKLSKEKRVLCFEMEAAGLMNRFPCMVIRGICDYSDSHKNKEWQGYAALTAAAYARDLLQEIQPDRVAKEERLANSIEKLSRDFRVVNAAVERIQLSGQSNAVTQWLEASDPSTNHNDAQEKHQAGTAEWLLTNKQFECWVSQPNSFLWLYGGSGCGKTVLSSTIIQHLAKHNSDLVIFFYFDFNDQKKQKLEDMMRSFLLQLYHKSPIAQNIIHALHESQDHGSQQPSVKQIEKTLATVLEQVSGVKIIIDALDESQTFDRVVQWLKNVHTSQAIDLRLLVTSQTQVLKWQNEQQLLLINNEEVNVDINSYVRARLDSEEFEEWHAQPALRDSVRETLVRKATGMFRWAALQLDTLKQCHSKPAIERALANLPKTLNDTYARKLTVIQASPHCGEVILILQMLVWSEDAMSIEAYNDAIVVRPDMTTAFEISDRLFDLSAIIGICSGLVILAHIGDSKRIYLCFPHASVKDYLLSPEVVEPFRRHLDEPIARMSILRTCLSYLSCLDWDFDDVQDFKRAYPFADYAVSIWPRQARVIEGTHDNVLALIIEFLHQDSLPFETFFRFTYPFLTQTTSQQCHPLYLTAHEGLVRSCRQLIQSELDLVNSPPYPEFSAVEAEISRSVITQPYATVFEHIAVDLQADLETSLMEIMLSELLGTAAIRDYNFPRNRLQSRLNAALVVASFNGHVDIVRDLLKHGASADAIDQLAFASPPGISALSLAAEYGRPEVVQMLIDSGATIDHFVPAHSGTALYNASLLGHLDVVEILLLHKADVNIICGQCGNALIAAIQGGHVEVVHALVTSGADVNCTPQEFNTTKAAFMAGQLILAHSMSESDTDVASLIQNTASRLATQQGDYWTAASMAADMAIARSLMHSDVGAATLAHITTTRMASRCTDGFSPLQMASLCGELAMVDIMIKAGVDVDAIGYHGTALRLAVQAGRENVVKLLLEHADANLKRSKHPDRTDWTPLEAAAAKRRVIIGKSLLDHGAKVNDSSSYSALALAATIPENDEMLQLLVDATADLEDRDAFGRTALQNAAISGEKAMVERLLKHGAIVDAHGPDSTNSLPANEEGILKFAIFMRGANINLQVDDNEYNTALQAAVFRGHIDIVHQLLEYGASVHAPGPNGNALTLAARSGQLGIVDMLCQVALSGTGNDHSDALRAAAETGHCDVVRKLVSYSVQADFAGPEGTALTLASQRGDEVMVRVLLEEGAKVDYNDGHKTTPLQAAVYNGHKDIANILLDHGADVNATGEHRSVLGLAVESSETEIVHILLNKGAMVDGNEGTRMTPLQLSAYTGNRSIMEALLDAGACLNSEHQPHGTPSPLRWAVQAGREDITRILLERGANVNELDTANGFTALQVAAFLGHEILVYLLVEYGADIDLAVDTPSTLVQAVHCGSIAIVQFLIVKGASLESTQQETPLQIAAWKGDKAIVNLLLDHGAMIDSEASGACALYQAVEKGHEEVVQLLIERGASVEVAVRDAWGFDNRCAGRRRLRRLLPPPEDCFLDWQDDVLVFLFDDASMQQSEP